MLELKNVYKSFNIGSVNEKHVLNDLNLKLNDGDKIVITGGVTNGKSGNTNLIKVETV